MDLLQSPDYSTPNKKKRFVESECEKMALAAGLIGEDKEPYLGGIYGTRRQKAILSCLDRAEEEFKTFGLQSVVEAFTKNELIPFNNYNHLDDDCDLRIGAALWILDKLRAAGKMPEAYKILPDIGDDWDAWYLPVDFFHPCYSNDLLQSVVHVITRRYSEQPGRDVVILEENAKGKKPGKTYTELLKLLPEDAVEAACKNFKTKLWELVTRNMKGQAYYDKVLRQSIQEFQNMQGFSFAGAPAAPFAAPLAKPSSGSGSRKAAGLPGLGGLGGIGGGELEAAMKMQGLTEQEHEYTINFDRYLQMDRKAMRRESRSREVAEALADFTVSDPYEFCFALFYLIDTGDDAPWLMRSGSSLMLFVLRMLPWHAEREGWDDDDWDSWYSGLQYNYNGWLDRKPIPDPVDYYHEKHNGRNLAQIVYDLCRGIVPAGLHPFENEREQFVSEGMDADTAQKITDMAEILFLTEFQAKQQIFTGWDFQDHDEEAEEEELIPVEKSKTAKANTTARLGGYWGKVTGQTGGENSVTEDDRRKKKPAAEERASAEGTVTEEKLQAELEAAKKQLKSLRNALAVTRQEANNERAKYEHELKALRLEHRELADLREIVFHADESADERARREKVGTQIAYPYETARRTVVFGGHEGWLKAIRPMLPGVRFVDVSNYAFHPELVRNADVVWIQSNCISHTQYGNILKLTRQYGIQLRYFGYAGAEKCAEQLVVEDQKG